MKKSTILRLFLFGAALFLAMLVLQSGFAQPARPDSGVAAAKPVNQNAPNDRPPSMKENVQVMVELSDVPAAVPYAEAMQSGSGASGGRAHHCFGKSELTGVASHFEESEEG